MSEPEDALLDRLHKSLAAAKAKLASGERIPSGMCYVWSSQARNFLEQLYGRDSPLLTAFPPRGQRQVTDPRADMTNWVGQLERILAAIERAPSALLGELIGEKIFIGHGRSPDWMVLERFLRTELRLDCDEFNLQSAAGMPTSERLQEMLNQSAFAFLVMTGEVTLTTGELIPRINVIHESGLFQAKLSNRRAIIILEEGCSDFSNVSGLTQVR